MWLFVCGGVISSHIKGNNMGSRVAQFESFKLEAVQEQYRSVS